MEGGSWRELQANLKGRDFFRPGPLMRLSNARSLACCSSMKSTRWTKVLRLCCLNLQHGSSQFLSLARSGEEHPFVVLTSNEERSWRPDPKAQSYVRVEHPTPEREAKIYRSRTPKPMRGFTGRLAEFALSFATILSKAALGLG